MDVERRYLGELTARLHEVLGDNLVGVYAGGSFALAGYEAGRSDLDVAVVVRAPLDARVVEKLVAAVKHEALAVPARKLELVVYGVEAARSTSVDAAFELNLNTGAHKPLRVDMDVQPGEEHWFAIDRSVLARHGVALLGPPAGEVFVSPSRAAILPLLAGVLRWYRDHEPESEDGVLNAGRSLRFAEDGVWVAKPDLRAWAREQHGSRTDILERAIATLERR